MGMESFNFNFFKLFIIKCIKKQEFKNQFQIHIQVWKVLLKRVIEDRLLERLDLTMVKKFKFIENNLNNINFINATK